MKYPWLCRGIFIAVKNPAGADGEAAASRKKAVKLAGEGSNALFVNSDIIKFDINVKNTLQVEEYTIKLSRLILLI